jgi:transcriptional regulator with XRE-family HTH domain
MQEFQTWYELLGHLVKTTEAKQQLARQLHVSLVTISRWLNHTSTPRPDMLRAILNAFPEHHQEFILLLARDHLFHQESEHETPAPDTLPSTAFTMHIFSLYRQLSPTIRATSIQQLVLSDAIEHLDPQQQGCACAILLCLPPRDHTSVRSLYLSEGKGTAPWPQDLRQECRLFGAESLAGAATAMGRPVLSSPEQPPSLLPSRWSQHEQSAFVVPLMRNLQIAGCLLVSSTQPEAFLAHHQQRITYYADLLLLAIETEQWYDHDRIQLQPMPSKQHQQPFFARLPQQIIARMVHDQSCPYPAMRMRIIQELEDTFVHAMTLAPREPDPLA